MSEFKFPTSDKDLAALTADYHHKETQAKLGWAGKLFGFHENVVCSIIIILLISVGVWITSRDQTAEMINGWKFWDRLLPMVASFIGYLYGRSRSS